MCIRDRLDIERDEKSGLPGKMEMDNYFDDDDKITDFIVNKNTYGDRMEITNVDRLYESIGSNGIKCYIDNVYNNNKVSVSKNEKCYKKIRLLYNDGG